MRATLICFLFFISLLAQAQKPVFDVFSYTPPAGWIKDEKKDVCVSFTSTNKQKGTWGQVILYQSTQGKGDPLADLQSEWQSLVEKIFQGKQKLELADSTEVNGWKTYAAIGNFPFQGQPAQVILRTYSGKSRCASLLVSSNDLKDYEKAITQFIKSVEIAREQPPERSNTQIKPSADNNSLSSSAFQFNRTDFDDGWTSLVKEDWVEVTKGNIRVLLHYPRAEEKEYISQQDEKTRRFWNLLVAPRYSDLRNYEMLNYNYSSEPAFFAGGSLKDNSTRKEVWVTLFSKGKSGWIEIITPDKQSFINTFGINNPGSYFSDWDPLVRLAGYNKFAIGEKDLAGKWSSDFSGSYSYYSLYTGLYTGSSTYASAQRFEFRPANQYNWKLNAASGGTGMRTKVDNVKASGQYKLMGNWQIWFSDIERKAKTYNAYFSCIKGGRVLWLQDTGYGGFSSYGKVQ